MQESTTPRLCYKPVDIRSNNEELPSHLEYLQPAHSALLPFGIGTGCNCSILQVSISILR
jgi:hypothetical protein